MMKKAGTFLRQACFYFKLIISHTILYSNTLLGNSKTSKGL